MLVLESNLKLQLQNVSSTREIQSNRWSVGDKIKTKIKKKDKEHQIRKILLKTLIVHPKTFASTMYNDEFDCIDRKNSLVKEIDLVFPNFFENFFKIFFKKILLN